jgi:hypothetical protein
MTWLDQRPALMQEADHGNERLRKTGPARVLWHG